MVVVLALAISGLASAETQSTGKIAFSAYDGAAGKHEVYVINADGSGLTKLGEGYRPRFSPDGMTILFQRDPGEAWLMNADGSDTRKLTDGVWNASWSPDARQIVFDKDWQILVMSADGTEKVRLIENVGANEWQPAWSPEGTLIAFTSNRDGGWNIHVVNAGGGEPRKVTSDGGWQASWSPDGKRIAFAWRDTDISIINLDGKGYTRLTDQGGWNPAWSSDGTRIAFDKGGDIWVMNADGSDLRQLTRNLGASASRPSWYLPPVEGAGS